MVRSVFSGGTVALAQISLVIITPALLENKRKAVVAKSQYQQQEGEQEEEMEGKRAKCELYGRAITRLV
jgi:hypothetical protein